MARVDSLILVMLGIAQILIGSSTTLEFLALLLQGSGGGTIVMAIYFLIFIGKHQKEFDGAYSKLEKTNLIRNENGELGISRCEYSGHKGDLVCNTRWFNYYRNDCLVSESCILI